MEIAKINIVSVTFGASFHHMFKLLDSWGEIADDILYGNHMFPEGFFPRISNQYTTERRLMNPDIGHLFVLGSNNLVFTQAIEKSRQFDKEFDMFRKRVTQYFVPKILSEYDLIIRRLGVVYTCEFPEAQIRRFASSFFNPSIENIIDFRFSVKEPTINGELLSESSDFINKIYTVGNLNENLLGISYDFQYHYLPVRADVRNEGNRFLDLSFSHFKKDIVNKIGE